MNINKKPGNYIFIIRRGMQGGSPRSVYKLLSSLEDYDPNSERGSLKLYAGGVHACDFSWIVQKLTGTEKDSKLILSMEVYANDLKSDLFIISEEEAISIDSGEEVNESPGMISKEIVEKINKYGDISQFIKINNKDLPKLIR